MKVTLRTKSKRYTDLTFGNTYRVIGIEAGDYRVMNDDGRPYLYPPTLFHLVDERVPADWVTETGDDGETYAYPTELSGAGFFEDVFDYKKAALATLELSLRRQRESESASRSRGRSA